MVTITPKQYLIWTSLLKGEPGKIPGNVLAMDTKKPFTQLKQFGGSFLTRYQKYKSSQTSNFIFQIWVFYCKVFCSWESLHAWHTRYITCFSILRTRSWQRIDGSGLTLGILAGEKQTLNRGYDFTAVLKWFAERADRIILLFDAHKLDISDEFKTAVESIRDHDDKIRFAKNVLVLDSNYVFINFCIKI